MVRRGVSILEVMFAIGVAAVGLLGVVAVIPLGLYQVGDGNVADRASRAGLNAVEEFQLRGMGDPVNWRRWTAGGFTDVAVPFYQSSFAIDPRLLAAAPSTRKAEASQFPYVFSSTPGIVRMPRLTLGAFSNAFVGPSNPNSVPMGMLQADEAFVIRDELVFDLPDEKTTPARQLYSWAVGPDGAWGVAGTDDDGNSIADDGTEAGWPGSDDIHAKRQEEGQFSWMATLTPKRDQRDPLNTFFNDTNTDLYTLSIIVFHHRNLSMDEEIGNERLAVIAAANGFHGSGIGGGEVTLQAHQQASISPETDLDLKPGDWVMLAGLLPAIPPTNPPRTVQIFRWYRVEDTEMEPGLRSDASGNLVMQRDATLYGPDWPYDTLNGDTEVILMNDIVAVYQKTIRMEFTSLYSS